MTDNPGEPLARRARRLAGGSMDNAADRMTEPNSEPKDLSYTLVQGQSENVRASEAEHENSKLTIRANQIQTGG